jgi:cobalt-zinc-cadmium efflux system outer membrane protein
LRFEVALALATCVWLNGAEVADAADATSFANVFLQAQSSSPRLAELEADVAAAEGHALQAKAWPMPALGFEREDFGGDGAYRGSESAQTTLSISEPIEIGGQRRARIEAGRAGIAAADARRVELRAEFGYELALAYSIAEAAQSRLDLLNEDLDRAREDARSARALVDAGREGELRALQSDAAAAAAQAEVENVRAEVLAALAQLSSLAGAPEPYTRVAPSLLSAPVRTMATAPPQLDRSTTPLVATARAERDSAEKLVDVEQKRAIPVPSFSVGRRHLGAADDDVWVAGFSIPLPIVDRNRGNIAAARADLRAADARLEAARLQAEAAWSAAEAQATAAVSRLLASDQSETSAREAYRLARIGYDAGRTPLLELLATRRVLTEAQLRSLDARVARVRAEAALAQLAGRVPFVE